MRKKQAVKNDQKNQILISEDGLSATFTINEVGIPSGKMYLGKFTVVTSLSPIQTLDIGREYRILLGPNPAYASDLEVQIAQAIANLRFRLISKPDWWAENVDINILLKVASMAADSEYEYISSLENRQKESFKKMEEYINNFKKMQNSTESEEEEDLSKIDGE